MRKIPVVIFLALVFISASYFFLSRKYHVDIGYLDTLKPVSRDIAKDLPKGFDYPKGSDLDIPLKVAGEEKVALFAELSGSPRVIAFDTNDTLVASIPKRGQVLALPDKDGDGVADGKVVIADGLNNPHGIYFYDKYLYIAETNQVVRYIYDNKNYSVQNREVLFTLPGGGRHWSRTIKVHDNKLYTSAGSSCDVCIEDSPYLAAIMVSDLDGKNLQVYAKGLRNSVFFDWDDSGNLWASDMGRDFLGDDLPPDELNIVTKGADYGWPWCYGEKIRDDQFRSGENSNYCGNTKGTIYNYQAHVAPLGTTFVKGELYPSLENGDLLVSLHGSWNRSQKVGYKVIRLEIEGQEVVSQSDFITGFLTDGGDVLGRPVDLAFNSEGVLFISDDKANLIYLLTK